MSGRAPPDAASPTAAGRSAAGGADTDWLGAAGAEGRAGEPNGASNALAGLAGVAAAGGRGTSVSGRVGGFTGIGTGACMPAAAGVGAALAVATGGTLRGWALEA